MEKLQRGDVCWVQRFIVRHYGVYIGRSSGGEHLFVDSVPGPGVRVVTRAQFACGQPIVIERHAPPGLEGLVVKRALALRGREYDLATFNCQHVANYAATGKSSSAQVQYALMGTLALSVLIALNENGTWVDGNGYRRARGGQFAKRRFI